MWNITIFLLLPYSSHPSARTLCPNKSFSFSSYILSSFPCIFISCFPSTSPYLLSSSALSLTPAFIHLFTSIFHELSFLSLLNSIVLDSLLSFFSAFWISILPSFLHFLFLFCFFLLSFLFPLYFIFFFQSIFSPFKRSFLLPLVLFSFNSFSSPFIELFTNLVAKNI